MSNCWKSHAAAHIFYENSSVVLLGSVLVLTWMVSSVLWFLSVSSEKRQCKTISHMEPYKVIPKKYRIQPMVSALNFFLLFYTTFSFFKNISHKI